MNRRVFLRGIGGVSLAAPFLPSVAERAAKAQGMTAPATPKRLVIHFTHNGCLTDRWWPKVTSYTNGAAALTADMIKGQTLEPLTPYIGKVTIPRGFRSMNAYGTGQSIDPHDQAMGSKLTCATIDANNKRYATAASLDHVIAKQINPNGAAPLVLSVGAASTQIKEILSFSAAGTPFPATVNPQTVYNQLTGVFGSSTGGTTGEAAWKVKRGQSALDLCKADLQHYQSLPMSKADQGLVQTWMDLFRSTETGVVPPVTPTTCSKSAAEAAPFNPPATAANVMAASPTGKVTLGSVLGNTPDPVGDANLAISFTKGGDMFQNLIALSMLCDMNRVILMLYPGYVTFNWDGIMHTKEHHGLSHRTGDFTVGGACGVTNVLSMINQIDQWYAGKYARLVGLLDSIKEGSGTLLDNTAAMWLPELSDGAAHNLNNLPIVVAGSCGGYLKTGQVINVEGTGTPQMGNSDNSCQDGSSGGQIGNTGSSGGNLPINKLYVTLMNAVGCTADGTKTGGKVTQFGQFDGTGSTGGITNPGEVTKMTSAG
ncbi:MAG TPA: DUF1552 domain-containing protein [Polyangia bacterium]|jgi:hypothetical protein